MPAKRRTTATEVKLCNTAIERHCTRPHRLITIASGREGGQYMCNVLKLGGVVIPEGWQILRKGEGVGGMREEWEIVSGRTEGKRCTYQ